MSIKLGIYHDMTNEDYQAVDAISCSHLKTSAKSLALYKRQYIDGIRDDADSKKFVIGNAFHSLVLEPDTFAGRYAVATKCDRRTKAGKEAFAEFEEQSAGRQILTEEDFATVSGMAEAVHNHPVASQFFNAPGVAEASYFAKDPDSGEMKKCRPDWFSRGVIFDLKSTVDASFETFQRITFNLKYYLQAAYYLDIVSELTGEETEDFVFIAVEKTPPYLVGVYPLDLDAISIGRQEYQELFRRLAHYRQESRFPGYNNDEAAMLTLPGWAFTRITENLENIGL